MSGSSAVLGRLPDSRHSTSECARVKSFRLQDVTDTADTIRVSLLTPASAGRLSMTAQESLLVCGYILVVFSGLGFILTVVSTVLDWLDEVRH
jgi:hypothetical protein